MSRRRTKETDDPQRCNLGHTDFYLTRQLFVTKLFKRKTFLWGEVHKIVIGYIMNKNIGTVSYKNCIVS